MLIVFIFGEFMNKSYDYISILGPTGSGKSDVAVKLANYMPIEIISADSVSVYRKLDIGSAKPSLEDRGLVPHHLIDVCSLSETYTVGQFISDAKDLIETIKAKGKMPVFCGGTMMYMSALKKGYQMPKLSARVAKELEYKLATEGIAGLYERLVKIDATMAARLHPNDKQRIMRALAVKIDTGKSLSEYWDNADHPYRSKDFVIKVNCRDTHRLRIAKRVDLMIANGLEKECAEILSNEHDISHPALRSIGYKEMIEHLTKNNMSNNVKERMCIATSQLVKRQMTWLNAWNNDEMLLIDLYDSDQRMVNVLQTIIHDLGLS